MKPTHCSVTLKKTTRNRLGQAKREMAYDLDQDVSMDDVILEGLKLLEQAGRIVPPESAEESAEVPA